MTRLIPRHSGHAAACGTARRPAFGTVLAAVVASTFVAMLAYAGPLGNVVTLSAALGASPAGTTWVLASMSVGLAVTLLVAGVVADEIGHRRMFGLGAATFAVANLVCALAPSTAVFVVARIGAGIGATGMVATGLGLVAAVSEQQKHRLTTATWWSVAMGSGIALGPVMTGLLDLAGVWRAFYAVLAAAGLGLWLVTGRLPGHLHASGRHAPGLDVVGFVLVTAALASLVTAIVEIRGGAPAAANALFVIAGVLVVGFVVSQRIGKATLVDPQLFRHGRFLAATSAAFGTGLGVIATMSFACTFLVLGLGTSTLSAGLLLAAWSGTSALAALVFARLSAVTSGAVQLIGGLVGTAAGLALLAGMSAQSGPIHLLPGLVVAGIASGLLNTGLAREAVASVPAGNAAMGTGANNAARYIGSSIGVTIASVVAVGGDGLVGGWNEVVMLAAAASLACAVVVAVLTLIPAARTPFPGRLGDVHARPRA